jgi:hypothetical protein
MKDFRIWRTINQVRGKNRIQNPTQHSRLFIGLGAQVEKGQFPMTILVRRSTNPPNGGDSDIPRIC